MRTSSKISTGKQDKILKFVRDYRASHGYNPTQREMAKELDMCLASVRYHLNKMHEKGVIELTYHKQRAIKIL